MADSNATHSGIQNPGVPQNNDSTTVQQQGTDSLPSTTSTTDLQSNTNDVNSIKTNDLKVSSGPVPSSKNHSSGTVLSIILVVVILVIAAGLFIASLRIPAEDKARPSVAPGGEENAAMGEPKKSLLRRKKK